jgi:hypothetical protein
MLATNVTFRSRLEVAWLPSGAIPETSMATVFPHQPDSV